MNNLKNISEAKIAVIGGGTGSFTLLQALKSYTSNISALVNMADDGGSSGNLRDEFGVLPPGDVRQCLVALSDASDELRALFNFRYPAGTKWSGHSFGNLFLSTVEMSSNGFAEAVKLASKVLNIRGKVIPLTLTSCRLVMEIKGRKVVGQHAIENTEFFGLEDKPKLWLEPTSPIHKEAKQAISDADLVVIAPGNLYASLAPALLVDGMKEALGKTDAKIVYVCNLINKPANTADYAVHDYVSEIERIIGGGRIDVVLYNLDKPTPEQLDKYALDGEFPVVVDTAALDAAYYQAIGGNFLDRSGAERNENDILIKRSLIRHNAEAVSAKLLELI